MEIICRKKLDWKLITEIIFRIFKKAVSCAKWCTLFVLRYSHLESVITCIFSSKFFLIEFYHKYLYPRLRIFVNFFFLKRWVFDCTYFCFSRTENCYVHVPGPYCEEPSRNSLSSRLSGPMTFGKIPDTRNDSEVIYAKWKQNSLRADRGKLRNIVAVSRDEADEEGGTEGKWILSVGWPRLARSGWLNYTFIN